MRGKNNDSACLEVRPRETSHGDDSHCARAPVRYALEMQEGWFAQRGLKPGALIGGIAAKK